MRDKILKIFLFLSLSVMLFGCRDLNGPEQTSDTTSSFTLLTGHIEGRLQFSDSPFHLSGIIIIDPSKSVTIDPGVQLFCDDSTTIIVYGTLFAQGTAESKILFTAFNTRWNGIKISNATNASVFQFAVFEKIDVVDDPARNGSIEVVNSLITVHNCLFIQNNAPSGGGISLSGSNGNITNSIFAVNKASAYGGGMLVDSSTARIVNNTFFSNTSWNVSGGIAVSNAQNDTIENNIFYQNASRIEGPNMQILDSDSSLYFVKYNFFEEDALDPCFYSASDFHLNSASPCIHAGDPSPVFNNVDGSRNDQGAYGGPLGNW